MFHIDVTFEDNRIIAVEAGTSTDDNRRLMMSVDFHDLHSGRRIVKLIPLVDLMRVLSIAASTDDERIVSTTYEEAKTILGGFYGEYTGCSPIP